jgi:hypothetical protein
VSPPTSAGRAARSTGPGWWTGTCRASHCSTGELARHPGRVSQLVRNKGRMSRQPLTNTKA